MADILNVDHKAVVVYRSGRQRSILVATYRSGVKAVIYRKTELWGEARLAVTTEFVVSTAQDAEHLKRLLKYASTMPLDCPEDEL